MSPVLRVVTVLGKRLSPRGQPEAELVDRCAAAARVARAGQVDSEAALVIPTGGDPARAGVTEAAVMARLLAEAGVAAARIVQETRAANEPSRISQRPDKASARTFFLFKGR